MFRNLSKAFSFVFHRRLKILIGFFGLAVAVLIFRLVWLQIWNGADYAEQARTALDRPGRMLDTVRGTIYDCRGRVLALDRPTFDLRLHYRFTRLYDDRFWQIERAVRFPGDPPRGMPLSDAHGYLRRQFSIESRALRQASPDELVGPERIREIVMAKADTLLNELAATCDVSNKQLRDAMADINDRIYFMRTDRARRVHCLEQQLPIDPEVNRASEIKADFERLVPEPHRQLKLIGADNTRIAEMNESHIALPDITEDVALAVQETFVGSLLPSGRRRRPVSIEIGKTREYPYRDVACHLIGQLCRADPEPVPQLAESESPSQKHLSAYRLDDRTGAWGTEYTFESLLRGRSRGWVRHDIDGNEIERIEPANGRDVTLTLDIELQAAIQRLFETGGHIGGAVQRGYIGGAVVIDVPTAQLLAAVSVPTFDLNSYYHTDQYRLVVLELPEFYSTNRALSMPYQPGSTIKPTTLLGTLQRALIHTDTLINCHPDNVWWSGPPTAIHSLGPIAAREAIKRSSNFYFIELAEKRLGPAAFQQCLKDAGFGCRILAWPPDPYAEKAVRGFRETAGHTMPVGRGPSGSVSNAELRFMGIGRGALDGSLLQIANSVATIARGGLMVPPTLVRSPVSEPLSQATRLATPETAEVVRAAMASVLAEPGGTAYNTIPVLEHWPDVTVFGKTGSTEYSIFACFARAADGRCLALAVLIEEELFGSELAAPLAGEILKSCADFGYLPPPAAPIATSADTETELSDDCPD